MFDRSRIGQVGLGLRRDMLTEVLANTPDAVDFWEVAPENWIPMGGKFGRQFSALTAKNRFVCHGLSLSIGSPEPLDIDFVKDVKAFLQQHNIALYTEHLSYCSGQGHMYDLMPIPFTEAAADYCAERIRIVQDILEQRIAIENVSYYAAPGQEITELEFTQRVLEQADCLLLLDVNNIHVNAFNHGYDANQFLAGLPTKRIAYGHIAGHYQESESLIVDTHGADVIAPVWQLLKQAYKIHGVFPTLLERDFNIPPLNELLAEVHTIRSIQEEYQQYATSV